MRKTTAVVKAGETWVRKDGTYRAFINRVYRGRAYFTTLPAGMMNRFGYRIAVVLLIVLNLVFLFI